MIYRKNWETAINIGADYHKDDCQKLCLTKQQLDEFTKIIAYECLTECSLVGVEAFGVNDEAVSAVDECITKIRRRFGI